MKKELIKTKTAADALGLKLVTFIARVKQGKYPIALEIDGTVFFDLDKLKKIKVVDNRRKESRL